MRGAQRGYASASSHGVLTTHGGRCCAGPYQQSSLRVEEIPTASVPMSTARQGDPVGCEPRDERSRSMAGSTWNPQTTAKRSFRDRARSLSRTWTPEISGVGGKGSRRERSPRRQNSYWCYSVPEEDGHSPQGTGAPRGSTQLVSQLVEASCTSGDLRLHITEFHVQPTLLSSVLLRIVEKSA